MLEFVQALVDSDPHAKCRDPRLIRYELIMQNC